MVGKGAAELIGLSLVDVAKQRDRAGRVARSMLRQAEELGSYEATLYALIRTTFDIEIVWGSINTWAARINAKRRRQFIKLNQIEDKGLKAWLRSLES